MNKILPMIHNVGGANNVIPVLQHLKDNERINVGSALISKQIESKFIESDLDYEVVDNWNQGDVSSRITTTRPDLIFTGTSFPRGEAFQLDRLGVLMGRQMEIPSIGILDAWNNYRVRFEDSSGNLSYLPDTLAVMDELAEDDLIVNGIGKNHIKVTGSPHFEGIVALGNRTTIENRENLRERLGIDYDQDLVTYFGQDDNALKPYGYTSADVMEELLDGFHSRKNMVLGLRPHPADPNGSDLLDNLEANMRNFGGGELGKLEININQLMMASDIVVTPYSLTGYEAILLGTPVISLQPGLKEEFRGNKNPAIFGRMNIANSVYEKGIMPQAIEYSIIARDEQNKRSSGIVTHSVERISDLIYSKLGI